jgi:hypothetical protein
MPKSPPKSAKVEISKRASQRIVKTLSDVLDLIAFTNGNTHPRCALDAQSAEALHRTIDELREPRSYPKSSKKKPATKKKR